MSADPFHLAAATGSLQTNGWLVRKELNYFKNNLK
jgi:hypothetical protein